MENPPFLEEELKELINNIQRDNRAQLLLFINFLLFSLILKWQGIEVSWVIIEILGLFLFMKVLVGYLAKYVWAKQTVLRANFGYFIFQLIEATVLLTGFYFFQPLFFGRAVVIMTFIIFSYFTFTRRIFSQIITFIYLIGYLILEFSTQFKILDYPSTILFLANISWIVGFFVYLALFGDTFLKKFRATIEILRSRTDQLFKKEKELEELKTLEVLLEKEIETKTKEIKDLTENLTPIEKEKKELQDKVDTLERFQKLAVGRELKMIGLKKEINKLKGRQKNAKNK